MRSHCLDQDCQDYCDAEVDHKPEDLEGSLRVVAFVHWKKNNKYIVVTHTLRLAHLLKVQMSSPEQQIYPWWCCRHSRWWSGQGWGTCREGLSSSPVPLWWRQKKKSEIPLWVGPMGISFLNWKCINVLQTNLPFCFSRLMIVQLTKVSSSVPFSFALVCLEKTIFSDIIQDVLINWITASHRL